MLLEIVFNVNCGPTTRWAKAKQIVEDHTLRNRLKWVSEKNSKNRWRHWTSKNPDDTLDVPHGSRVVVVEFLSKSPPFLEFFRT